MLVQLVKQMRTDFVRYGRSMGRGTEYSCPIKFVEGHGEDRFWEPMCIQIRKRPPPCSPG